MSTLPSPSTILQKPRTPTIFSLIPTSPLSLSTPHNLRFPPLTLTFVLKSSKHPQFSSQPGYDAASNTQPEEEEEAAIGDCLVYEEGIFDDPYLQTAPNFRNGDAQVSNTNNKDTNISTENLIPEKWLDIQRELNITKKERRKLSQELEYGRTVEKRRQSLRPLNSEEYDRVRYGKDVEKRRQTLRPLNSEEYDKVRYGRDVEKRRQTLRPLNSEEYDKVKYEKLQQLNPVVLDNPEPKYLEENDKHENGEGERSGEGIRGRVAPRNPRLAVYGVGLEDISALFSSGSYDPGTAKISQGARKLFSKEEKLLLNKRVPDLAIATSGKWHPLHTLAASGEFYLVNSLLKHNLDINAPDKNGLTAIHKAILGKKQAIFNFLLRESANPFVRDEEGATLMHYAVFTASSQMIKFLLLYNVDINLQNNDGWTALHLAVQSRRTDIVRLLLIKGADKSLKNRDGLTALDLCLYSGRDTRTYELIKLLNRLP